MDLDELLEVAESAILLLPKENEVIFKENTAGDAMYLVVEGKCYLERGKKRLAELSKGSHFGEMSLLSNAPRFGSIVTSERSKLLRIASNDFQEIIHRRPTTGVKLLLALGKELSNRLAETTDRQL